MGKKGKSIIGIICVALLCSNSVFASDGIEAGSRNLDTFFENSIDYGVESVDAGENEENKALGNDSFQELEGQFIASKNEGNFQGAEEEEELFTSEQDETDSTEQSFDLILKEDFSTDQFVQVVFDIYENVNLSAVSEIALVHVDLPLGIDKNEFVNNEFIMPFIYAQGEMPAMDAPQNPIANIDLASTSLNERPFYSRMTNEELFEAMAWHVNEVTNDGASLEISKGNGTKVALIDSGIDISHPVLSGKIDIESSKSYVENDLSIQDTNGHGTIVAGIIAQIAPEAQITSYRVIGDTSGNSEWSVEALVQAVNDGNDIINMSLGTYKCSDTESELVTITAFERAVQYAESRGAIVVASSGNKALNLDMYYETEHIMHLPGGIDGVITISATNDDTLASYSNYGSDIDYCAPGGDLVYVEGALDISQWIYCLYPTTMNNGLASIGVPQGYTFSYGTSLAAPEVTAALADILSQDPNASSAQLIEYLNYGVTDLGEAGYDIKFGMGKINIESSLLHIEDCQNH